MSTTLGVRKEVVNFTKAAEILLSPVLMSPPLTQEECDLIAEYVMALTHVKNPWSKSLAWRYAS